MTNDNCPNPECNSAATSQSSVITRGDEFYRWRCERCMTTGAAVRVTRGKEEDATNEALRLWRALPRKLIYTNDIPSEPGSYWRRYSKRSGEVFEIGDGLKMYCNERWQRVERSADIEWAGPIPEPREG